MSPSCHPATILDKQDRRNVMLDAERLREFSSKGWLQGFICLTKLSASAIQMASGQLLHLSQGNFSQFIASIK